MRQLPAGGSRSRPVAEQPVQISRSADWDSARNGVAGDPRCRSHGRQTRRCGGAYMASGRWASFLPQPHHASIIFADRVPASLRQASGIEQQAKPVDLRVLANSPLHAGSQSVNIIGPELPTIPDYLQCHGFWVIPGGAERLMGQAIPRPASIDGLRKDLFRTPRNRRLYERVDLFRRTCGLGCRHRDRYVDRTALRR